MNLSWFKKCKDLQWRLTNYDPCNNNFLITRTSWLHFPVFMCLTTLQDINPILFTVFTVLYSKFYGLVLAFDISDIVNEKMYNFIAVSIDRYKNLLNTLFGLNFVFIVLSYVIDGSSLRFTIFETAYIFSPKLFYFVFSCLTLLISLFLYTKLFKFKRQLMH